MLTGYKKIIKITEVHGTTGVLTYNLVYDTMANDLSEEITRIGNSLDIVDTLPRSGDKLFFLNGVTIPRFKIKKFYEDTGAKGVKYLESANLIVIGKKTIQEHFEQTRLYRAAKEEIIKYIDNWKLDNTSEEETWAVDLLTLINEIDEDVCIFGYYNKDRLIGAGVNMYNQNSDYIEISTESYDKLEKILNLKCTIIDETTILKQLNSTVVMNHEIFNSIQNLMNSSDQENMKIAMELMSNCDYDSSGVYLLLLLKQYSNKIERMHTKHHINFKAMLTYFDFTTNSNFNISTDEIIEKLKSKNTLSSGQMTTLVPYILEDFNPKSEHYRVSDVIFKDEEGEDIIVDEIQEIEIAPSPIYSKEFEQEENDLELDHIIYDELSEVIGYCSRLGFSTQRDILLEVRALCRSSEDLLEVIKFLDKDISFDYVAILTQAYLDIP